MEYRQPILANLVGKLGFVYRNFDWITFGLLAFILLIPKFQLIPVNGTYINVRIEDFVVVVVYGIWLLGVLAGRFSLEQVFNRRTILGYLIYGLVITLLGVYVFETVKEPQKLGFIHWARRVEYFGIYFLAATSARRERLHQYLYGLLTVGVVVWLYGFLQWQDIVPGVHTLNKSGQLGSFSELGYVISTFAAHYDFGAFLILMVLLSAWGYFSQSDWRKRVGFVALAFAFWWMSRLVYGRAAYLGMLAGVSVFLIIKMSAWALLPFWEIFQTFDRYLGGRFSRYAYNFRFNILPETPPAPTSVLPSPIPGPGFGDLVRSIPKPERVFIDAIQNRGEITQNVATEFNEQNPSLWKVALDNWVSYWSPKLRAPLARLDIELDPSANIRLAEWQDALARVGYHYLWGGGYYTAGMGTDNDFLRQIVEVGVFGLALFLLMLWDFVRLAWRNYLGTTYPVFRYFHLAMIGFIVGLLVEAVFIDIFEASKIAFLFWYLMGLIAIFAHREKNEAEATLNR